MHLHKYLFALILFTSIGLFSSCKKEYTTEPPTQEPDLTELRGAYVGQTPPGNVPVKFAPNNLFIANGSWWWQSSPVFSPDGNEMYFTQSALPKFM